MVTCARSENLKNEKCLLFPKMKPKSYWSKMKQNNSTELLGHAFNKIYNKNSPHPHPTHAPDPRSGFSPDFPGFAGFQSSPFLGAP